MARRDRGKRIVDGLSLKPAPGSLAAVQRFVNTRNLMHGYDLLEDVSGASDWLYEQDLLGDATTVSEAERRRLVAFREGMRALLLSHNGERVGESGIETLNDLAGSAPLRTCFDPEGEPRLSTTTEPGGAAEKLIANMLVAIVGAAPEGTWRRLKACRNEDCRWAFFDASKNRSGNWCTMDVCGARHKMRTYRSRRDEGTLDG